MGITFKEFQLKAEQVDVHPEKNNRPWEYALTGLLSESGKLSKTLEAGLPKGKLSAEDREKAMESAWTALWFLAVACHHAGFSLEEVAERGFS
jgi:hypothetical protein